MKGKYWYHPSGDSIHIRVQTGGYVLARIRMDILLIRMGIILIRMGIVLFRMGTIFTPEF